MTHRAKRSERTPYDEDDGVTVLQEKVLGLLEAAGIPTAFNYNILALIADGERAAYEAANPNEPE